MQKKSDLFVITKSKDLAKYIITVTEKSPKMYRFTLVTRLQNYVLDALENLYMANATELGAKRAEYQNEAKKYLGMTDYFAGIAAEEGAILFKQYEQIGKQVAEALLYLNKWMASDEKRVSTAENG